MHALIDLLPTNAEIAELLSREASDSSYVLQRAYRRAAGSAFLWEVEARDLVAQKRPLTELAHIGPFLQKQIRQWIRQKRHPPRVRRRFGKNFAPWLKVAFGWLERRRGARAFGAICKCI